MDISTCSVINCKNQVSPKPGVILFSLPRNPFLVRKWLEFVNREDFYKPDNFGLFRICTEHFASSSFRNYFPTPALKSNALPTLKPPRSRGKKKKSSKTEEQLAVESIETEQVTNQKEIVIQLNEDGTPIVKEIINTTIPFNDTLSNDVEMEPNPDVCREITIQSSDVPSVPVPLQTGFQVKRGADGTTAIVRASALIKGSDGGVLATVSEVPDTLVTKKKSPLKSAEPLTAEEKIRRLEETVDRQKKSIACLRAKLSREKKTTHKIISSAATNNGPEIRVVCEKKRGYTEEARKALLEIYSMAPHLYPKFSKALGLPAKTTLRTWFPLVTSLSSPAEKPLARQRNKANLDQSEPLPDVNHTIEYFY